MFPAMANEDILYVSNTYDDINETLNVFLQSLANLERGGMGKLQEIFLLYVCVIGLLCKFAK